MWENPAPAEKDDRLDLDQDEGLGVKLPLAERLGAAPAELQVAGDRSGKAEFDLGQIGFGGPGNSE